MKLIIAFILVSQALFAEEKPKTEEKSMGTKVEEASGKLGEAVNDAADKVKTTMAQTRENRESTHWTLSAHITPFTLWTMMDYGVSASYHPSAKVAYELDFTTGQLGFGYFGVDIGRLRERKYSFIRRSYSDRNSFHFATGIFINDLDVKLGNKYLSAVAANRRSEVDLLQIQTAGLTFGLGNRWQFKSGAVFGLDWLMINLPVWTISQKHPFLDASGNQDYVDDIQSALKLFRHIPTLALLRIQAGYSF